MKKTILTIKLVLLLVVASISIPSDSWAQICDPDIPGNVGDICGTIVGCGCRDGLECVLDNPNILDSAGVCQLPDIRICDPDIPGSVGDICGTIAGCGCRNGLECVLDNPNIPDSAGVCQLPDIPIPPSSSLELVSPPDGEQTDPVTVFRWTRSDNPAVSSYRLIIATDQKVVLDLPEPGDERITAPQVAVKLNSIDGLFSDTPFFWRVIALDESGNPVEQSQNIFSSFFIQDQSKFTVISGLVQSNLNQEAIVGARVAISSERHAHSLNKIAFSASNGEYIVIALTTNSNGDPILSPILIESNSKGFQPTTEKIEVSEWIKGDITRVIKMMPDSDGDGILDKVEIDVKCLDANDADTDNDGILDGDEDTNKDGILDPGETNPCESDTDKDGIQDGTERGYTMSRIGPDTDINKFQPDLDPTTKTDPLDDDSDNDGLLDGEEDLNHNGRVDPGETDPRKSERRARPWIPLLLLGE